MVIVVTENTQNNFEVVEVRNAVTGRNARFDVILTSVTKIEQVFFFANCFVMSHLLT